MGWECTTRLSHKAGVGDLSARQGTACKSRGHVCARNDVMLDAVLRRGTQL